jgi:GNAT superfamily N-acetyltransferase
MPRDDPAGVRKLVRITHLEMRSPSELRPALRVPADLILLRASIPSPELGRFLYTAVGGDWYWRERLSWTYNQWLAWLGRADVETWVALASGTPAGYFELHAKPDESVELTYFGLLPGFAGRGLGGYLLTQAVERSWRVQPGTQRVTVHTCTLDHAAALPNYLARGFKVFQEEEQLVELPEQPPGPWPGAERPR